MGAKDAFVNDYWKERQALAQEKLTRKSIKETEEQLKKYYFNCMESVIGQFETTYNTYLLNVERGLESSPATLYKLDTYWQAQARLRNELLKLGDKEAAYLGKQFTRQYMKVYKTIAMHDGAQFSEISYETAFQMINEIWCADGSSWNSRIWKNTNMLQQALNDGLIECVVNGAPSDRLKSRLMYEFGVSFNRADNLVRTELAHIQTQAARQRYADAGVKEVQVWADKDERQCEICGKLHKQKFLVGEKMPIPAHPRCRCTIIPVIEVEPEQLSFDDIKEEKPVELVAKNLRNEEITFNDRMLNNNDWKDSIEIIKKLSTEYDTRLVSVAPGAVKAAGTMDMGGNMRLSSKKISDAIHEFGHSLAMEELTKYKITDDSAFWKEIKAIRRKYNKDVGTDTSRWISSYANTNTNEFMAEAFTHAKLKELEIDIPFHYGKDFTYSDEVLKVINKYFKKKKK